MSKEKYYFESIEDTMCYPLEHHLDNARSDGLKEITLVNAIPDKETKDHFWCSHFGECVEREICRKAECDSYTSKSGRGACSNRGNLFLHGEEETFKV